MGKHISHDKPHQRPEGLNPRVRGPFLEDVRKEQERAYREARNRNAVGPEQEEEENANGE